jgi:eukaryotic-like serine/threonine-protein kinase
MKPAPTSSGQVFRFGLFEADVARNTLTRNGMRVKIQDQPLVVLILLLERPSEIVSREELRHRLWPADTYVDFEGSLNVILKKLRAAIDDDSENPRFIETVPRHGYRFIAPVSVGQARALQAIRQDGVVQNAPQSKTQPAAEAGRALTGQRLLLYAACTLILVSLTVAAWFASRRKTSGSSPRSVSASASAPIRLRKSVAVLGFHNISGRTDDTWLATAFPEMLRTELAGGEKLRLVSSEGVANLLLSSPWPQTDTLDQATTARIGTALNSDLLVMGSYTIIARADRTQLRVDVRLQEAKTGEILAELAETGNSQDLFRIVSRVGARLRDRMEVPALAKTDEAGVLASLPFDPDAARFYALGLNKLRQFDASAAKDLLEQASMADPKFSLAHAMLARAWSQLGYEQKRRQEAKLALDLATDLPRAERMQVEGDYYASLAEHEKAASTYRALFELFPDNVEYGLQLASTEGLAGHQRQALETIAQLRRLPPPASLDPRIDIQESRAVPGRADALVLLQTAERRASSQGLKLVYALARLNECVNLVYGEHPEQAGASCEDAYNVYMAAGNRLLAADAIRLMADQQGAGGHFDQAIATYQRALMILQELGEHSKTAVVLNNMAIAYTNEGNLGRGEQLYREAKSHFEKAGDKGNAAIALANIADILYIRGNLPAAAKAYQQAVEIQTSLENGDPSYSLYRLADLELAQGRVRDAHRLAQQALDSLRAKNFDTEGAMSELGDALQAEGDLNGAQRQYQAALDHQKARGRLFDVAVSQASLGGLAVEQGHPEQAEPLLRLALAEFEKEKQDPAATSAYTALSRSLLMQGKLEEARKAIQIAAQLGRDTPDPALKFPIAIQQSRIAAATAGQDGTGRLALTKARQQLRSTIVTAKKLGYYQLEGEARLALAEAELKANPAQGRLLLQTLVEESHERGLELVARKAQLLAAASQPVPSPH